MQMNSIVTSKTSDSLDWQVTHSNLYLAHIEIEYFQLRGARAKFSSNKPSLKSISVTVV